MPETYPEFHDYTDEEWLPIAAALARLGPATLTDRSRLNRAALDHQLLYASAEPASPERKIALACYEEIELHILGLFDALDRLDSLRKTPSRLDAIARAMAMATDPPAPGFQFDIWRQQTGALMHFAKVSKDRKLQIMKDSNRSLGITLQGFLAYLLDFWIEHGGHAGKSPNSPAVRFVRGARLSCCGAA